MAARKKVRAKAAQLGFEALSIEGGLLSPEWLSRVAQLSAGAQSEADYRIKKGLNLRDEIGRYWRIARAHWNDFVAGRAAKADQREVAERFVVALLRDSFEFGTIAKSDPVVIDERSYPIGFAALAGRVPVIVASAGGGLEALSSVFGDGTRRRNAFGLAQEYLNAQESALWGIASDGVTLRILRDNASLTRPVWIEADLERIFTDQRYPDFAALWLLAHETRFGRADQPVTECALETWRNAGREEGTRAREHLRRGVEDALLALGQGFIAHPENQSLRSELQSGALTTKDYFNQLLRLVYRLIFLLTAEERGLLHPAGAEESAKTLYAAAYGMRRLRERSVKRSAHDRYADLWEATKIVLRGLAVGEPRLGLPALAGIFAPSQCPALDGAKLTNSALLLAVFRLAWLREDGALARVNWRDMGPEELGSVYESLLELVPQITQDGRKFAFATGGENKGNARKTTGSYYTPDSLVQVLLDSTLEPVIADTIARNRGNPAEALLGLSVVDPACGSGHFLLAAARRLASHVARLQADGTPSSQEYRHALRQVVGRCIYGVDLNPMAVELCKVSLWMEALEPGLPLTFLNSHIQRGNALLGTTPELMANGIPDAAWEPIEGDDKKIASALKKQNKKERTELSLDFSSPPASTYARLGAGARAVDEEDDATLIAVQSKEKHWVELVSSPAFEHQRLLADIWCAAFVWERKGGVLREVAPTDATFRALRRDETRASRALRVEVERLSEQYAWFHWHLQFPQVFAKGGFDVVLGNPPWDEYRPEEKAFFRDEVPEVAAIEHRAQRHQAIAELERVDRTVAERWRAYRRMFAASASFLHWCGRYELTARGNLSTAVLFTDLMRAVVSQGGRAGLVVPSGLATNQQTAPFFGEMLNNGRIVSLFDFENRARLFPDVDGRMRFSLLTLRGDGVVGQRAAFGFSFHTASEVQAGGDRVFMLNMEDVRAVNPDSGTCPVFATKRDADLVLAIHRRLAPLSATEGDAWGCTTSRLFDISHEAELLSETPSRWSDPIPLLEGKMIQQFDHRAADVVVNRSNADRQAQPRALSDLEHTDPRRFAIPRYWVDAPELRRKLEERTAVNWLLHFCPITSATNERTCIAAIAPLHAAGHSLFQCYTPKSSALDTSCVLANLNAFVFDFILRQKLGGINLSHFIMRQMPVGRPSVFRAEREDLGGGTLAEWVSSRVLELTFTSWDLEAFARDLGYEAGPLRWDPARRLLLRCELDAAFFHLYGLSRDDTDYVMDSFPIVRKDDEKAHGEYRTKRVILEIYDAMSEAARTGRPYETRLDPPPADPRVAHPDTRGAPQ